VVKSFDHKVHKDFHKEHQGKNRVFSRRRIESLCSTHLSLGLSLNNFKIIIVRNSVAMAAWELTLVIVFTIHLILYSLCYALKNR